MLTPFSFSWWRSGYSDHPDATHCPLDHHHYIGWNGQFGSQYRDHHEDDDHSFHSKCSPLNLIPSFQFVCSCHVTIRMQHKTNYKSWLKQILKNIWGLASREKFSVQESSNFLPLCQTLKVLFIFIAQISLFCVGWYWVLLVLLTDVIMMPSLSKARASKQCCEWVTPHLHCDGLNLFNHNSKCCFMTVIWKG